MPVLSTLGAAIANVYGFTSGLIKDQYFNLVSLLLPGNGTDGKQNRTFKDSSVNDFLITPNGNATQGTFSPFSQTGWGNYFNGSSYLTSSHPALNATFTIEAWIYRTSGSALQSIIFLNAGGNSGVIVYIDASNYLTVTDGSTGQSAFSNLTVPINSWTHIAVVRSGGTTTGYVNGTVAGSHTFTPSTVNAATIARYSAASPLYFPGYVSNVRVVNGTAVYTGAFTPSTVPLTAITNTSLLTCQSNRFIDNSSSPLTITASGSPQVTPFSPFAPTQSYSASAVGGSGYFDGTGDYLSIASNAAFQFGAGNFTLEAWVYLASYNGSLSNMIVKKYTAAFPTCEFLFQIGSTGQLSLAVDDASNETFITTATSVVPVGAWAHCVATRSGSALRLFVNGKLVKYGTTALTIVSTSTPVEIGNNIIGNIGGLRIFKGSIPTDYQTSSTTEGTQIFTPPTAPLTTTSQGGSSPSLLLNFTNAGVIDATAKNVLETVGTAQISSTTSKFPPTSIYLSGDGNYLTSRSSPVFSLNGDFTMEAWVYPINAGRSADAEKYGTIVSCAAVGVANPEFSWFIRIVGGVVTEYFLNLNFTTVLQVTGLSVSLNAWHYFAVTRSGTGTGNLKLYIDGTLVGTSSGAVTQSATFTSAQTLMVGRNAGSTAYQNWLSGYFQDVRITPGYVRTVTTIPTAPFPVQ
jgi:hypothetical protein